MGDAGDAALVRHEGRGSEGFLDHVYKHAAKELFGVDVQEITYKNLRSATPVGHAGRSLWICSRFSSEHALIHSPIVAISIQPYTPVDSTVNRLPNKSRTGILYHFQILI